VSGDQLMEWRVAMRRVLDGERGGIHALLEAGCGIDQPVNGNTPLVASVIGRNLRECIAALDAGASINMPDVFGRTALSKAISTPCLHLTELLISRGANVHVLDTSCKSMLHLAVESGVEETCEMLLRAGVDVNACAAHGYTALHFGASGKNSAICDRLLRAGADIRATTNCGSTPLHSAAIGGSVDVCRLLVAAGADRHAVTCDDPRTRSRSQTPFQQAVRFGSIAVARYFIDELGEDPKQRTASGRTLSQLAAGQAFMRAYLRARETEVKIREVVPVPCSGSPDKAASSDRFRDSGKSDHAAIAPSATRMPAL
jgi:ankyrin repeat protein